MSALARVPGWWLSVTCALALLLALALGAPPARAGDATMTSSSASLSSAPLGADAAPAASAEAPALATASAGSSEAATTMSRSEVTTRAIHGLAPLLGGAPVPESDRPPGSFADDGGPSPVIFPEQRLTLRFNHARHVKKLGLSCTTCHDRAKTSHSSADSLLPKATRCDGCHGTNHRDPRAVKPDATDLIGQCAFCHVGYKDSDGNRVARMSVPAPHLRFDHSKHVQRNIACQQCHGEVQNLELATRDQMPRMRGCFGCHQAPPSSQGEARGQCTTCHLKDATGRMRTEFAQGPLLPPRWLHDAGHGPDWIERHKRVAGADSQLCGNCHAERYCTDCHDGRVRPRSVHPNDWISMHPVAARQADTKCTSCHREQSFCLGCHQRAGVVFSGPAGDFAERGRFHPPKSVWRDPPRTSQHHAWEAERNLNACVSCHVERDCISCHATRGVTGADGIGAGDRNPHPPGFSSRCGVALRKNARPCLACHDPSDPNLEECR